MLLLKKLSFIVSLILIFGINSLRTENLAEVYELALKNDPLLKAAEATYRAGKENKAQGIAGLLPSLTVSGTTTWNEYRVEEQLIDQYNSNAYLANLNQPIFRLDKWFQFERGNALSEAAAAEFAYQQQETMIRVASAYFNVLNSIDSLNAARAEEKAIGRQKDLAKKRFDVGLAAITEVQETQAAYDLTVVSRIARESQLDTAQEKYKQQKKEYYQSNKEKIKAWGFNYREKNADKIKERRRQKITCECGSEVSRDHLARHKKSKKHQKYLENKNS